jgi:hypothetical protein
MEMHALTEYKPPYFRAHSVNLVQVATRPVIVDLRGGIVQHTLEVREFGWENVQIAKNWNSGWARRESMFTSAYSPEQYGSAEGYRSNSEQDSHDLVSPMSKRSLSHNLLM